MDELFPETLPDLQAQIAEVRRELDMRERNYPGFVRRGLVTQANADLQMTTMRAVLNSLQLLQAAQDCVETPRKEG